MFTVLTNARCILPRGLTRAHLVLGHGVIQAIVPGDSPIPEPYRALATDLIDVADGVVLPGLIDGHTHPLGAAGESGPSTRAPEIPAELFARHGITTVVGMLGADQFSRSMADLITRTRALRAAGLSAYCLSGSYRFPPTSLGESVPWDLFFIPEILGAGEIALSDIRSSAPTPCELRRFVQESLSAARSAGKRGVVLFHIGDEPSGLSPVLELSANSQLDCSRIIATHLNRNERLFAQVADAAEAGVWCDLTAIEFEKFPPGFLPAEEALAELVSSVPGAESRLTVTSDCGTLVEGKYATSPGSLFRAFRKNALDRRVGLERAVRIYMENPALCYGLQSKGSLAVGKDADLIITDDNLELLDVYAGGVALVQAGVVKLCERVSRVYSD
jgi:beta-aspartyl-dipeptidase (metallo-type)